MHREAGWAFASQIVTSGANFVNSVLLVRAMGVESFGRYTLCFLAIMISRNFLNATVLVPMSSLAPKLKNGSATAYRGFALAYAAGFAGVSSLILLAGAALVATTEAYDWLGPAVLILALANTLANMADFLRRYFFVIEKSILAFFVDFARFSVQIALILFVMAMAPEKLTVSVALLLLATGGLVGLLVGLWHYGPLKARRGFLQIMWVRHWRFARWMLPATALEALQGSGPLFILGALMGDAVLGIVRAIQQVANLLNLPINTMVQILPSMASRRFVTHGEDGLRRFLVRAGGLALALVVAGVAVLVALSGLVIRRWMGIEAPEATVILIAFGLRTAVVLVRQMVNIYLYVHERSKLVSLANLAGAIGSVTMAFVLARTLAGLSVPVALAIGAVIGIILIALLRFGNQSPRRQRGANRGSIR